MEYISGKENKRIKQLKNLMEKSSARKKSGGFVTEGLKMVNEAFVTGYVKEIAVSESLYRKLQENKEESLSDEEKKMKHALTSFKNAYVVSDALMKTVSDTVTPQGVLAVVEMPNHRLMEPASFSKDSTLKFLFLEDLSDPGNLGTIVRTAEAAGITAILCSKGTVDLFNPKTVRSTMGSIFRVPVIYVEDLKAVILSYRQQGVTFYATHLKAKKSYKEISYEKKAAILIGNEANGLSDEIMEVSDLYIKIPMEGKVESLNAAVAAALMMYELP